MYFSGYDSYGGLAATYAFIQLWNPAASGVLLEVVAARLHADDAAAGVHALYEAAAVGGVAGGGTLVNLFLGGAVSAAEMYRERPGAITGNRFTSYASPTAWRSPWLWTPELPPIVLDEGEGLNIQAVTVDLNVAGHFVWREIPI